MGRRRREDFDGSLSSSAITECCLCQNLAYMTLHLTHLTVYLLDVHVYPIVVIKRLYPVGDRKMKETRDVAVTDVFESVTDT